MRGLGNGEVIHVESWIGGQMPRAFRWRGSRHTVRVVEEIPTRASKLAGDSSVQREYSLSTSSGLRCVLLHDTRSGTWSMKQVLIRRQGGRDARRNAMV